MKTTVNLRIQGSTLDDILGRASAVLRNFSPSSKWELELDVDETHASSGDGGQHTLYFEASVQATLVTL